MPIRQPSTKMSLLRWHRAALRGDNPPRHDGHPECGWYKMRKVKHGPFVPVEIYCVSNVDEHGELTEDEYLMARVSGIEKDPVHIWTFLRPIAKKEYDNLIDMPLRDSRYADPNQPITLDEPTPPN